MSKQSLLHRDTTVLHFKVEHVPHLSTYCFPIKPSQYWFYSCAMHTDHWNACCSSLLLPAVEWRLFVLFVDCVTDRVLAAVATSANPSRWWVFTCAPCPLHWVRAYAIHSCFTRLPHAEIFSLHHCSTSPHNVHGFCFCGASFEAFEVCWASGKATTCPSCPSWTITLASEHYGAAISLNMCCSALSSCCLAAIYFKPSLYWCQHH